MQSNVRYVNETFISLINCDKFLHEFIFKHITQTNSRMPDIRTEACMCNGTRELAVRTYIQYMYVHKIVK